MYRVDGQKCVQEKNSLKCFAELVQTSLYCRKKNASLLLNVRLMIFKNDAVVNKNKNLIVLYENSTFFLN